MTGLRTRVGAATLDGMMHRAVLSLLVATACKGEPDPAGSTSDTSGEPEPTFGTTPTPEPGEDTVLASLDLGGLEPFPAFQSDRRYYVVQAGFPLTLDVTAEARDADAEVSIRLETPDGEVLGTTDPLVAQPGNRLRVDVTSANGAKVRSYSVALLPDSFPMPTVEGTATEGWTFLANSSGERFLMIVDGLGVPGWWRFERGGDLRISEDGRITWHGRNGGAVPLDLVLNRDDGSFDAIVEAGPVPDGWESVQVDEHEWFVLADGTGHKIINGKVLEDLTPWGGPPDALVEHQKVQHVDLDGNVLFEFSTQGLLPYDVLPPGVTAKLVDGSDFEPFHVNSISVDPSDGHWVLSLQRVSMIVKVARHGPQEGEVLWRLNGPLSDFTIHDVRDSGWVGFAGQHDVRVVAPNRLRMYDAGLGDGRDVGDARVLELELDMDTMEAHVVWEKVWDGRGNGLAGGSVQPVEGGGLLVGFGSLRDGDDGFRVPTCTELDADGNEVWRLTMPGDNWSYRAWRFLGDPMERTWSFIEDGPR